jgi:hypothetical protein
MPDRDPTMRSFFLMQKLCGRKFGPRIHSTSRVRFEVFILRTLSFRKYCKRISKVQVHLASKVLLQIDRYITRVQTIMKTILIVVFARSSYDDSSCRQPLLFVLSPGADPLKEINKLALKMDINSAIKVLILKISAFKRKC